jgi:Ca2+-binding RTX toxin-like protein
LAGKGGNDIIYGDNAPNGMSGCTSSSPSNDRLWGGNGNDVIYGGSNGPQTMNIESIFGGNGNDKIFGDIGNDDLFGQSGADDIVGGPGDDYLFAGESDPSEKIVIPAEQGDRLWGGPGKDVFDCGGLASSIIQDFESGIDNAGNCTTSGGISWTEKMCSSASNPCYGTDLYDELIGDGGSNLMYGKGWNDIIIGNGGPDQIYGEVGNDYLYGGSGDDLIDGGLDYGYIYGGRGNDKLSGGNDRDIVIGGPGADRIIGTDGDDFLYHAEVESTFPDGSKDILDCGAGTGDEVWINKLKDRDQVINCEIIHG